MPMKAHAQRGSPEAISHDANASSVTASANASVKYANARVMDCTREQDQEKSSRRKRKELTMMIYTR